MKVAIATKSPDKIKGVLKAITQKFGVTENEIELYSKSVQSDVSEQPFNDETYQGALNRISKIQNDFPNMDLYISCEAGIESFLGEYFNVQVVCISDSSKNMYWGKSSGWQIPSCDIDKVKIKTLDKYLRERGINCIEELLGNDNSREDSVTKATQLAFEASKLKKERKL